MPDNNICPLCGYDKIDHEIRTETVSDHYSGSATVSLNYDHCQQCGTDGDFGKKNDKLIREALDELKADSVKDILEGFSRDNINIAGMERALELPQRTLAKWKSGTSSPTAAGVTLLKFLKLFPWLVDVADCDFDYDNGQRIHIQDAVGKILPQMHFFQGYSQHSATIVGRVFVDIQEAAETLVFKNIDRLIPASVNWLTIPQDAVILPEYVINDNTEQIYEVQYAEPTH